MTTKASARYGRTWLLSLFLVCLQANAAPQVADYYEDALRRFDAKDVSGAIVQLKNALHQNPNLLPAQILLADAYLMTGSPAAAEVALEAAEKLGADRAVTAPKLAQALLGQLKYQLLLDRINAQGLPPLVAAEIQIQRGTAFMGLGKFKQADQALREAERLSPESVAVKVSQGTLALRQGNLSGARTISDRALAMAPNDADAWNLKASIGHVAGNLQAALSDYGKVLSLNPAHLDARLGRTGLLIDQKRYQEAQDDLIELKKYIATDPRAAYLVAMDAARRGDQEATRVALAEATELLDQYPPEAIKGNAQLLMLGGLANYGLGQPAKARTYLQGYIVVEPRHAGARKLLASILLDDRDYNAVIEMLYPMAGAASPDPKVLSLLASAYMGKKQYQQATELFEKAARIAPDAADAGIGLGMSHLGAGRAGEGIAQLQAVFAKNPGQAQAGLMLAAAFLSRGEAARAAEVARKIVAKEPGNLTALNLLGNALVAGRDRAGARAAFTKAAQQQPNFLPAQLGLVRLDSAEGKGPAARKRIAAILKVSIDNPEALLELARLEHREGRRGEAIRWLERVHAGQSKTLAPQLYLVELYLQSGDAKRALGVAQELEAIYPENLSVLGAVGQSYVAVGSTDKARATFNRMSRHAGFESAALANIARLLMSVRAFDDAAVTLNKAVTNNPGHLPSQILLVELDMQAGRLAAAEKRALELRAANPSLTAVIRLLGSVRLAQKNYAGAISEFKNALDKENSFENSLSLYYAYSGVGDVASASAVIEQWMNKHPDHIMGRLVLGQSYSRANQLQKARKSYEQVLKVQPDNVGALNNLANVLRRLGDPGGLGYAEKAYALAPASSIVLDTLGWLLVQRGDANKALPLLRDASLRESQNSEIRYHLAVALERLGRASEAKRELKRALASGNKFEGIEEAKAMLGRL